MGIFYGHNQNAVALPKIYYYNRGVENDNWSIVRDSGTPGILTLTKMPTYLRIVKTTGYQSTAIRTNVMVNAGAVTGKILHVVMEVIGLSGTPPYEFLFTTINTAGSGYAVIGMVDLSNMLTISPETLYLGSVPTGALSTYSGMLISSSTSTTFELRIYEIYYQ